MKSKIYKAENKEDYFDLLLIADEQREMIERYLKDGTMFVLDNDGVKGEIVVCDAGSGVLEIKNLAVFPELFVRSGRNGRQPSDCPVLRKMRVYSFAYR